MDDSKEAAVAELGSALTAIAMEGNSFGEFTLTVVVYDEDQGKVRNAVARFQKLFTEHDGVLYEERYNLLNAFFATVPGNRSSTFGSNGPLIRITPISHFCSRLIKAWSGILIWNGSTSLFLRLRTPRPITSISMPVMWHTRSCSGATGSGKSFALNFVIQSLQKYDPLTFIFDLGGSYESLTRGFRGSYLNVA